MARYLYLALYFHNNNNNDDDDDNNNNNKFIHYLHLQG